MGFMMSILFFEEQTRVFTGMFGRKNFSKFCLGHFARWRSKISRIIKGALVTSVRLYQAHLSVWIGGNCRFVPSCSEYAIEALQSHSCLYALALIFRRIWKCRPLGACGFDPVPSAESD